ncbi:hypothetical protein FO519_009663, partial [Halicephalobus sp. NKZ332]
MYFFTKYLIIFVSLKDVVESCMRIGAGGGGVPVPACDPNDINFVMGDGVNSITGTHAAPVVGADGTTTMVVTCDATGTPNAITLMTDQNGAVLGNMMGAPRIDVTLVCDGNGNWIFQANGAAGPVTEVNCDLFVENPDPCAACAPVALEPGNAADRLPVGVMGPAANNGVCEETVTCTPRNAGGDVFMEFVVGMQNIGNPLGNTATLTCTTGDWMFSQNNVVSTIDLVSLKNVVESCMRIGAGNGGDTPVPVCDPNDVQLVAGNNVDSVTPTRTDPVAGADGTTSMTVTCDVSDTPGATTFLQFNGNIAPEDPTDVIMTTLVCTANGWTYTQDGVATVVNSVNCLRTAPPPACDPNDINFVMGDGVNSITGTHAAPVVGADGTTTMVVTCDATGTPNAITLMTDQNGAVLGNMMGVPRIDVTLVCDGNGNWVFQANGAAGPVTEVNCDLFVENPDPCAACAPVALEPGNAADRLPVGVMGPAANNGVCEETVTCTPRNAGGDVFMEFAVGTQNIGNPLGNTATLTCTTGDWMFNQNNVVDIIDL